MNTIRAT